MRAMILKRQVINMNKVSTSDRLKYIMAERNLKQIDILNMCQPYCKKYNVKLAKNDLSQYVSGKVAPGQYKLTILGMALGVNEVWLMGYDVPMERMTNSISLDSDFPISDHEKEIILTYRKSDDLTKAMVLRTLGLDESESSRGLA